MKKRFIFETDQHGNLLFDFQFELKNSIENSFSPQDFTYGYLRLGTEYLKTVTSPKIEDWKSLIPIGSVEYVVQFFKSIYNIDLKPINIPDALWTDEYLGRRVSLHYKKAVKSYMFGLSGYNKFIKSANLFKDTTEIYRNKDQLTHIQDNLTGEENQYLVSDVVDIVSEYRVFVHRHEVQDVRRYSGDYKVFPDIQTIDKMVRELERDKNTPIAYTIDVAVIKEKGRERTVLIEMHDFFSIGLYGFDSYKLPYMFSQWHYEKLRKEGIEI